MIGVQTPAAATHWLLLDVPGAPRMAALLQDQFVGLRCFWLFEGTELHPLREQGPALVELRDQAPLLERCYAEPRAWQGLLLESDASVAQLLAHLRRMLMVSVGLHHRALLNYYNPHCASYFFDACDAEELTRWLGPINQLRWFGGTWADRAIGSQGWQQLLNPRLAVSPLAIEENLSVRQQERLQCCLLEQHTWHWSRSTGTDYNRLWSHVQEGLALGFSERPVLDDWLWLRLQCPDALPEQVFLPGLSQRERLEHLRRFWQGDFP